MSKELPTRPSLRNLKIQAKNILKACRSGDAVAKRRISEYHPKLAGQEIGRSIRLSDVQWALAREYGFESWPKLVASLPPEIRYYQRRRFDSKRSIQVGWIGRNGEDDPCAGGEHTTGASTAGRGFVEVPECRIWFLEPDQINDNRDWETIASEMEAAEVPGICLRLPVDDRALEIISQVEDLRYLNICSGPELTDEGLLSLKKLTRLEYLQLGGYGGLPLVTDRGLSCLEAMPELKVVRMNCHQATDASVGYLKNHQSLRLVQPPPNTGDEALQYLKGKPYLSHLFLRCRLTDQGLDILRDFPALATRSETAEKYRIIEYSPPMRSALFFDFRSFEDLSDSGLEALADLHGVEELWLNSHDGDSFSSACLNSISRMSGLVRMETGGRIIDNFALSRLGGMSKLESLYLGSGIADDGGLESLASSRSLKELAVTNFGGITSRGIQAVSRIHSLEKLHLGLHDLPLGAYASLGEMPRLKEFNVNYAGDEVFESVSQVDTIESVMIMYCHRVTDQAIHSIERLPNLRELSIWSGSITDASCESIRRMHSIEKLLFYRRDITDSGIRLLATLPHLKSIDLQENLNVSRESLKAFRPDVRVNYQPPPEGYIREQKMLQAVKGADISDLDTLPIGGNGKIGFDVINLNARSEYQEGGVLLNGRGAGVLFPDLCRVPFSWKAQIKPISGRWNLLFGKGRIEMPSHNRRSRILFVDSVLDEDAYASFDYKKLFDQWVEHRLEVRNDRLQFFIGDEAIVDVQGDYRDLITRVAVDFRGSLIVRDVVQTSL